VNRPKSISSNSAAEHWSVIRAVGFALAATALVMIALIEHARAIEIQEIETDKGITVWLVEENTIPLMAMHFAFLGGAAHDPEDRQGLAAVLSAMLDEGAGDLDSQAFQTALAQTAVKLSFDTGRDRFFGRFQTLTRNRDEAFELLRLAINEPRFDLAPLERMQAQLTESLRRKLFDPDSVAIRNWMTTAFGDHPYARDPDGTVEGVAAVTPDDLRGLVDRLFTRDGLFIAVVGDIDAETLSAKIDLVFGDLTETSGMNTLPEAEIAAGPIAKVIDMDIPQSVIQFGHEGILRDDPDFIPAYVMNHILGGGGLTSRLTEEIREKRGLTYSVYSYLSPLDRAGLVLGSASTRNESASETLALIREEIARMAKSGPTEEELELSKTYLTGSYALRFDTSTKIAGQLLGIQLEDLGIDYIEKRNGLIEAITIEDVRRVAARLLKPESLIVTVVGRPTGIEPASAAQ